MMPARYNPADSLPFRIPGEPSTGLRAQLLNSGEFSYGLELLEGTVAVPHAPQWNQQYFDLVKYELTAADWKKAVVETIRIGNDGKSRMPSPETMIARAGIASRQEPNYHAGRWIFRCEECGRKGMTQGTPVEPPAKCRECEERSDWSDRVAAGG